MPGSHEHNAGHAYWEGRATRLAFLSDGVEYYPALRAAIINARHQIVIIAWEFHSEVELIRGDDADALDDGWPTRIGPLLEEAVRRRPTLHVSLCVWRPAPLFAFERQLIPPLARPWRRHRRLGYKLDADHPPLASHHQKIIAIDDAIAFTGGMDVTGSRWDTHEHIAFDERRRNTNALKNLNGPYHDVQALVDGDAARALADIARTRWNRVARSKLRRPPAPAHDPWPEHVQPDVTDARLSIFLTQAAHKNRPQLRQVEHAFLDQIRRARKLIFVENQYLASRAVIPKLAERLAEPHAPEIIIILPHGCPATAQASSMDTQRDEALTTLREADTHGRLRVYWAPVPGESDDIFDVSVYIHAKVLTIDDDLLRIGSANLNNRSMGLDSECDLVLHAEDRPEVRQAIADFRHRLLAYLLGVEPERVADAAASHGSLLRAIESLRNETGRLDTLTHCVDAGVQKLAIPHELSDPDRPLHADEVARILTTAVEQGNLDERVRLDEHEASRPTPWWWFAIPVVLIAIITSLAAISPLSHAIDLDALDAMLTTPHALPAIIIAALVASALAIAFLPITLVIILAPILLGPVTGAIVALGVAATSAIGGYAIGRAVGRQRLIRIGRHPVARTCRRVGRLGIISAALVRNLPISPHALVNLAAGAMHVSPWRFITGSLLGMIPGILAAAFLAWLLRSVIDQPTIWRISALALATLTVVALAILSQRWARAHAGNRS